MLLENQSMLYSNLPGTQLCVGSDHHVRTLSQNTQISCAVCMQLYCLSFLFVRLHTDIYVRSIMCLPKIYLLLHFVLLLLGSSLRNLHDLSGFCLTHAPDGIGIIWERRKLISVKQLEVHKALFHAYTYNTIQLSFSAILIEAYF